MKKLDDVLPKNIKRQSEYWTHPIGVLEEEFVEAIGKPEENFFTLCFIVHGIWGRFYPLETALGREAKKEYRSFIKSKKKYLAWLKKERPGDVEIKELETWISHKEAHPEEYGQGLREDILKEINDKSLSATMNGFKDYVTLRRLRMANGKPAPMKMILALEHIAQGIDKYPYLYIEIARRVQCFENIEKVEQIEGMLRVDAESDEDGTTTPEMLAENDEYIKKLCERILDSTKKEVVNHVEEWSSVREQLGVKSLEEKAEALRLSASEKQEQASPFSWNMLDRMINRDLLLSHEEELILGEDLNFKAEYQEVIARFVVGKSPRENIGDLLKDKQRLVDKLVELVNDPENAEEFRVSMRDFVQDKKNVVDGSEWKDEGPAQASPEAPKLEQEKQPETLNQHDLNNLIHGELWEEEEKKLGR